MDDDKIYTLAVETEKYVLKISRSERKVKQRSATLQSEPGASIAKIRCEKNVVTFSEINN